MILTVHDELLFEAPKEAADETAALVRERMEGAVALRVPLTVDVGRGRELERGEELAEPRQAVTFPVIRRKENVSDRS